VFSLLESLRTTHQIRNQSIDNFNTTQYRGNDSRGFSMDSAGYLSIIFEGCLRNITLRIQHRIETRSKPECQQQRILRRL
jgi:hypothetical protein